MCIFLLMLFIWCTVKCVHNVHTMLSYLSIILFLDLLHTERTGKDKPTALMIKWHYFTSFRRKWKQIWRPTCKSNHQWDISRSYDIKLYEFTPNLAKRKIVHFHESVLGQTSINLNSKSTCFSFWFQLVWKGWTFIIIIVFRLVIFFVFLLYLSNVNVY